MLNIIMIEMLVIFVFFIKDLLYFDIIVINNIFYIFM